MIQRLKVERGITKESWLNSMKKNNIITLYFKVNKYKKRLDLVSRCLDKDVGIYV